MKRLMQIELRARAADPVACRADALAVGVFKGQGLLPDALGGLDPASGGQVRRLLNSGDFKADVGSVAVVYGQGTAKARRILVVGLGQRDGLGLDQLRRAAAGAASSASALGARHLILALHLGLDKGLDAEGIGRAVAEGASLGAYSYDEFVTDSQDRARPQRMVIEVVDPDRRRWARLAQGLRRGAIVGQATNLARTWANRPANRLGPAELAALARETARRSRSLTCVVRGQAWLDRRQMGGILAVGAGSKNRPCLIEMRYRGRRRRAGTPDVALVGKAVTFDSGGISIKPSTDMDQMKLDKTGGAVVVATMKAIDQLGLGLDVLGLIPAVENLPSGTSYRPGDIITTYSGKTVEVVSTDAEGRLILADALSYAVRLGCTTIVDIATLTGACMVALGRYMAGLMGNDQGLIERIQACAKASGEPVWPLPCGPEYAEEIKGRVADLRNTGSRWGGACTAAAFLGQFVGQSRWAHLDIAGVDMVESRDKATGYGASGFGVRLLTSLVEDLDASGRG